MVLVVPATQVGAAQSPAAAAAAAVSSTAVAVVAEAPDPHIARAERKVPVAVAQAAQI